MTRRMHPNRSSLSGARPRRTCFAWVRDRLYLLTLCSARLQPQRIAAQPADTA